MELRPSALKEQIRQARDQVRVADEKARQAQEREVGERQQKEKLLAQLRALGIEPTV